MFPTAHRLNSLSREVLGRFGSASLATRLYLNARWRWTPYEHIARRVPPQGKILDLGSGHGLLSLAMGLSEPGRVIHGIDHEAGRVAIAQRAAAGLTNLAFSTGSLLTAVAATALRGEVAGIVIMDALHYLSFEEQERFLAHCLRALQPGGVLLIRDVDASAGKTFLVNRMHERVMTGLGLTRADRLSFRSRSEWLELLAGAGFTSEGEPCSRYPFADLLFVCRAPAAALTRAA